MMRWLIVLFPLAASLVGPHSVSADAVSEPLQLESPGGHLRVSFQLGAKREPTFEVACRGTTIVAGKLGLEFAGRDSLREDFEVIDVRRESRDETYAIPVGKASSARDRHKELVVSLKDRSPAGRRLDVAFRAFDDGVAFRYLVPPHESPDELVLTNEHTQLTFPDDPTAHLLPLDSYTTSYEKHYRTQRVSEVEPDALIGLPILLERSAGDSKRIWLAVTEAGLTDYAGMYLARVEGQPQTLIAKLSPLPGRSDGAKVIAKESLDSPWRVLMIADDPGRLLESNLVFHLNEPSAVKDASWIKPGRTTFPWWNGYVLKGVDFEPGLNTATHKHYIDFCAKHGIEYHSLDGTDTAWYGGPIVPTSPTDVTKAVPEIDLPELFRYAKEKGVRLRLWMYWKALKPQLDEAFRTYEQWGVEGVMIDFMDRDDQEMVAWYHEVAEEAARRHLTVTWHGAYKPTGMERTWPNVLTYEAAFNQEYNKWDPVGTPPEHNLNIAFIRSLAGPVDYHHGGMRNVLPANYIPQDKSPLVQGTRGHQLAMYVVYQNHMPMMVDYPAAYEGQPGLDFIAGVSTTWDETRVLHAEFGRSIVVARRQGNTWYVGGMTAAKRSDLDLSLEFLGAGVFRAELLLDDPNEGPTAVTRREQDLSAAKTLRVTMPVAGGFVARLTPMHR